MRARARDDQGAVGVGVGTRVRVGLPRTIVSQGGLVAAEVARSHERKGRRILESVPQVLLLPRDRVDLEALHETPPEGQGQHDRIGVGLRLGGGGGGGGGSRGGGGGGRRWKKVEAVEEVEEVKAVEAVEAG